MTDADSLDDKMRMAEAAIKEMVVDHLRVTLIGRLTSALERIRDLHADAKGICRICTDDDNPYLLALWPCPTRRIVDEALAVLHD